jgi:5-methylcytosine-specific restriction enzyme subunit McrC
VEWWLKRVYPHLQIKAQSSGVHFVKDLFTVRPDFLIKKDNQTTCVADAKWKLIDEKKDFSQSDFYQLFAYRHIFLSHENSNEKPLRIYYPKTKYLNEIKTFEYFDGAKIEAVPLEIEEELKSHL